jgi:hypothetical protein
MDYLFIPFNIYLSLINEIGTIHERNKILLEFFVSVGDIVGKDAAKQNTGRILLF